MINESYKRRIQELAGINPSEGKQTFDVIGEYKRGNPFLESFGIDENQAKILHAIVNIIANDNGWMKYVFPEGCTLERMVSYIDRVLPHRLADFLTGVSKGDFINAALALKMEIAEKFVN